MPCRSELAQFPMPAMARRTVLMEGLSLSGSGPGAGRGQGDEGSGVAGCGGSRPPALGLDQALDPGDITFQGLGPVLDQSRPIGIRGAGAGGQPLPPQGEGHPTALQETEPGLGREVAGEGQPQGKGPVVLGVPGTFPPGQECLEEGQADGRDGVHLAGAAFPGAAGSPGGGAAGGGGVGPAQVAVGGPLASEGPRHGYGGRRGLSPGGWGRARPALGSGRQGLHRSGGLQPGQGRVQGAEGDGGQQPQSVAEAPLQLVAVHLLLPQQAQDGQVEHAGPPFLADVSLPGHIYRTVISLWPKYGTSPRGGSRAPPPAGNPGGRRWGMETGASLAW